MTRLTPEWISGQLDEHFSGVDVTAVSVIDQHDGTTGRARLELSHRGNPDAPSRIFVKLPPADPAQQQIVRALGMGVREARFYAELGHALPVRAPRCYSAVYNGEDYLMLLEDLESSFCRFPHARRDSLLPIAEGVMDGLARLHSKYWDHQDFKDHLNWIHPALRHEIGPALVTRAAERFRERANTTFLDAARLYTEATKSIEDLWDRGTDTLVHGDCHLGNLFVDGDEVGFLDWACTSRAPGMRDVTTFLCGSLPTELRRSHERDLLRRYLENLDMSAASKPSLDQAWSSYRGLALYPWVAAATTAAMGDAWQPAAIAEAAVDRTTTALDDLGSLEMIRRSIL